MKILFNHFYFSNGIPTSLITHLSTQNMPTTGSETAAEKQHCLEILIGNQEH